MKHAGLLLVCAALAVGLAAASPQRAKRDLDSDERDRQMHASRPKRSTIRVGEISSEEYGAAFWREGAQRRLREALARPPLTTPAKNVIMFLGDGMSVPTLAAARIYQGQMQNRTGESDQLFFETFPYAGLSKTYCVDVQVADSACTSTSYLGGVKTNEGALGVSAAVKRGDCAGMLNASNHVTSILKWGQDAGKSTGIVSTARVTHASPAGGYAHISERNWESDADLPEKAKECRDIAHQLIYGETGKNFKVILGGGRREFLPNNITDPEGKEGRRKDGQNLIEEWQRQKEEQGDAYQYVWNRTALKNINYDENEYLLGLFESSHMQYNLDAIDSETEPTLADLTEAAIKTVSKNENGYILFIEGGRIDMAHHDTLAMRSLDETVQMAEAVRKASELTSEDDTLIVVTADHAHTLSIAGYPRRGNDIFGLPGDIADDRLPYTTLSYANGLGYEHAVESDGKRHNPANDDLHNKDYTFPAMVPRGSETHGGDDVAVLSRGPFAHLLTGVFEQNYIPHVMAYAACVGRGATACDGAARRH